MLAYGQLRDQIIQMLSDKISLDDFEDWFVQNSWNVHQDSNLLAQRLAYAVELRLAELSGDRLSRGEFENELRQMVNSYPVKQEERNIIVSTSSSIDVTRPVLAWLLAADTSRVTASESLTRH